MLVWCSGPKFASLRELSEEELCVVAGGLTKVPATAPISPEYPARTDPMKWDSNSIADQYICIYTKPDWGSLLA